MTKFNQNPHRWAIETLINIVGGPLGPSALTTPAGKKACAILRGTDRSVLRKKGSLNA